MNEQAEPTDVAGAPDDATSQVFVSYSRDDIGIADQLAAALRACRFIPTVDRHAITGGEDWKARLGALILEADTVVFLLSPSSARSDVCAWEVAEALRLGKRILPAVVRPLADAAPPKQLQDLNYIFFYPEPRSPGTGFGAGLAELAAALRTDLGWIREHTRLLERASEWDGVGRPTIRLLSGTDIAAAKAWVAARPRGAPEPTVLHLDYIRMSEEEEASRASAERQRLDEMAAAQEARATALRDAEQALRDKAAAQQALRDEQALDLRRAKVRSRVAVVVAVGALGLAGFAAWQTLEARRQKQLAEKAQSQAEDATFEAIKNRSQSLIYAAENAVEVGSHEAAILFAIEALDVPVKVVSNRNFYLPRADTILALQALQHQFVGHSDRVTALATTADGQRLISASDDRTIRFWRSPRHSNGPGQLREIRMTSPVRRVAITRDGKVAAAAAGNSVSIWDEQGKAMRPPLQHEKLVTAMALSPDGGRVVTASEDRIVRVWSLETGEILREWAPHQATITNLAWTPDGTRVASAASNGTARVSDAGTGAMVADLVGHQARVGSIAVSRDGTRIATGSADRTARVWDAATGRQIDVYHEHVSQVNAVAFMPDGRLVTAAGDTPDVKSDNTVRLWEDVDRAETVGTHFDRVAALAIPEDGGAIFSAASVNRVGRIWMWDVGKAGLPTGPEGLERVKKAVPRCLDIATRARLLMPVAPPQWCVASNKPPYDAPFWSGYQPGMVDEPLAEQLANASDAAFFQGGYDLSVELASTALLLGPRLTWAKINKAHGLMMLGRTDEARTLYLAHAGEMIGLAGDQILWDDAVRGDFAILRDKGLETTLLQEIEQTLPKLSASKPPSATASQPPK